MLDAKIQSYLRECRQALETFRETSWRCEKISGRTRCRNYWVGHEKGHQFLRSEGSMRNRDPSLLVGEFQCTWDPDTFTKHLYAEIDHQEGCDIWTSFPVVGKRTGVSSIRSNRTCFTCLSECPVYILPCEHVQHTICQRCAIMFKYSPDRSQATLSLQGCPLGCRFKGGRPWHSRIKPSRAGVRILSLDG